MNGGNAFTLSLTVAGEATDIEISAADTNASAVVNAINQAGAGVSAQLVDTGVEGAPDRYKIVLTGQTGASNAFSVSTDAADTSGLNFTTPTGQDAADAAVTVNGVAISRSTNTIDDVITGVTLDLQATTSTAASLTVVRDATGVKEKIQGIVEAYNNLVSDFGVLSGPKSDDPDALGGQDLLLGCRDLVPVPVGAYPNEFFLIQQMDKAVAPWIMDPDPVLMVRCALQVLAGGHFQGIGRELGGRVQGTDQLLELVFHFIMHT